MKHAVKHIHFVVNMTTMPTKALWCAEVCA